MARQLHLPIDHFASSAHAQATDHLQISDQTLGVAPLISAHAIICAQKQARMRFDARALLRVARAPARVQAADFTNRDRLTTQVDHDAFAGKPFVPGQRHQILHCRLRRQHTVAHSMLRALGQQTHECQTPADLAA